MHNNENRSDNVIILGKALLPIMACYLLLVLTGCNATDKRAVDINEATSETTPSTLAFANDTGWVKAIRLDASGKRLVAARENGNIDIFDLKSGERINSFHVGNNWEPSAVCFSPDGVKVAVASDKISNDQKFLGVVQEWDWERGVLISERPTELGMATAVKYSSAGTRLYSAYIAPAASHLEIRELPSGQVKVQTVDSWLGRCFCLSPDDNKIGVGGVWSIRGFPALRKVSSRDVRAFSPDGKTAYSVEMPQSAQNVDRAQKPAIIRGLDAATWKTKKIWKLRAFRGYYDIYCLDVSYDGKYLLACFSTSIRVWRLSDGKEIANLVDINNGKRVSGLHEAYFFDSGTRVVAGDQAGLRIWDLPLEEKGT